MTQSGQEPPESGRRAPDVSGNSQAPKEQQGQKRRRRKRRKGRGASGQLTGEMAPETGVQGTNAVLQKSGSGHGNQSAGQTAEESTGAVASARAQGKKRRRGRNRKSGAGIRTGSEHNVDASAAELEAAGDSATSAKGKKAARRRGRRRWQSKNLDGIAQPIRGSAGVDVRADAAKTSANGHQTTVHRLDDPRKTGPLLGRSNPGNTRRQNSSTNSPLYAALDLGTNNCRLLIARPEERGFRVVDAYSRIVRLGEGVGVNRTLSDGAMERAIDALANCHRKLADRGVTRSRLIATEACRAAENGDEFISRVQAETGLVLEVVNRETEARLAVAGCASLVDQDADGVILFDIGGGSSEIVWLDLRNRCGARGYALTRFIRSWISLPVGVVNLAERHGGMHVTSNDFESMIDDAAGHLAEFNLADDLTEAISSGKVHMLGTSGTVTTLAGIHLGLKRYDRRRVDGIWLEDAQVGGMIDQLRDMPYEARVENPCIGADRADLVLAGCAILEAIRRRWSCSRLRVADRGLREGILTELMSADGVWARKRPGSRPGQYRQRNRP
ncbi:MAG: Ppx/GppA phosphatase family protein [Roseibium sp.]